jgi:hypothetical protein
MPDTPVPTISFDRSPAQVTIGEGLRLAGRYWRASVAHWILPVAAVALVNLLAALLLGGTRIATADLQALVVTGPAGPALDGTRLPRLLGGPTAVALVSLVARWFLVANAIAGLRGTEITLSWVLRAGLRAFCADLLMAAVAAMLVTAAAMLGVVVGAIGLILLSPLLVYVLLRLEFWMLAIFDGEGIAGGFDRSWRLTRGAVLRVFGWALVVGLIGPALSAGLFALELVLARAPAVLAMISATLETMLLAFTTVVTAVLYESQRVRTLPPPVLPPVAPASPFAPPPPPPPPPSRSGG